MDTTIQPPKFDAAPKIRSAAVALGGKLDDIGYDRYSFTFDDGSVLVEIYDDTTVRAIGPLGATEHRFGDATNAETRLDRVLVEVRG